MSTYTVVGAGPVGAAVATQLAAEGNEVTVVTRSGSGPGLAGVRRVAADAGDAARLAELADGSDALFNCVNPVYHRWPTDWPPVAAALLAAAEATGAVLVTTANLYPYGPVDGAMVEGRADRPAGSKAAVRSRMTADAMAAHEAGRLRAVEVRGSDYVGIRVQGHLADRIVPKVLAGKGVSVVGSADQPHTWTYTPDMAGALVAAAWTPDAWGSVWHAPSNPPRTQREAIGDFCQAAGVPPVKVGVIPHLAVRALGLVNPAIRALEETRYQFTAPFVMDSTRSQQVLGVAPTPWDEVCARIVAGYRG